MLSFYLVNAFTRDAFGGNPAAVLRLNGPAWPAEAWMQAVAAQFKLSETAFVLPQGNAFGLRWFTPQAEVDLCGHATLASAQVLLKESGQVDFDTRSGRLTVNRQADGRLAMDFPSLGWADTPIPPGLADMLGAEPVAVHWAANDYLVELKDEATVAGLAPDLARLKTLKSRCVAVTASGKNSDFVSRVFGPRVGIDEDPVTGSTHCFLGPYWGGRLKKTVLKGRQLSARGGEIEVRLQGPRVLLLGWAVTVAQGQWLGPQP